MSNRARREDQEVDAGSREMAGYVYDAALREGRTPDEALDLARDALQSLRRRWREAQRKDARA